MLPIHSLQCGSITLYDLKHYPIKIIPYLNLA
jgi:hypothetical protein